MNLKEHLLNRITDAFEELNVSQDIIDELDEYLNDEINEKEFLAKLPKIDFSKINKRGKSIQAVDSIIRHKDKEYLRKYINALYEMGRESANVVLRRNYYSFNLNTVNEFINVGVEKYKVYSMYLEANAYEINYLYSHLLYDVYKLCKNEPEEAKKIIENLKSNDDIFANAAVTIISVYCALKNSNELEVSKEDDDFYKNILAYLEESMLDSIGNMYDKKLPENFVKKIVDFIKSDKDFEDEELKFIINATKSYEIGNYLLEFLVGLSYLNFNNSRILNRFVKFFAKATPKGTLDSVYNIMPSRFYTEKGIRYENFYSDEVYNLDKSLGIKGKYYILWYAERFGGQDKGRELLEKKFKENSKAFEEASKMCEPSM
ncbi:MAG: hypothetical protein MSA89_06300, partial [Clostridium sp.]|nr:hypothetical protein [Clostridium sp.]